MNHPKMKNLSPEKIELIRLAASQTKGKSGKDLAPVMLALITNANKRGIRFTPDETAFILELLKEGRSPSEQAQIDRTIRMTESIFNKHARPSR